MKRLAHIIAFLLLASFATGMVAHSAVSTEMSLHMSVAAADGEMSDCGDCNEPVGTAFTCDPSCVQPFTALPSLAVGEVVLMTASHAELPALMVVGQSGPPEPHPPQ